MKKLDDLKNRFFVSAGLIILFVLLIIFSDFLFMRTLVALALCILASIAVLEYSSIAKAKKVSISNSLLVGSVVCEVLAFFIYSQYLQLKILPVIVFLLFLIFLFISNFKNIEKSLNRIAITSFGFLYIAIPLGMILPILYMQNFEMQDGRYWVLYLIFVTKLTDIGAYFGGKLFGKKKLAVNISPKKTIFGSVSGIILAIIGSLFFLVFSKPDVFDLNILEAIMLGLILGAFAQFGDLCESLLKRDAKIKNSSTLPGLGGILDMVDSLIFNIPIMYIFLIG
jgi:phosphatidate cytidylyltransferase